MSAREQVFELRRRMAKSIIGQDHVVYLDRGEAAAFGEIPVMRQRTAQSKDFEEGIASFREKRTARFVGG